MYLLQYVFKRVVIGFVWIRFSAGEVVESALLSPWILCMSEDIWGCLL
ncbi:hypothetical protein IM774_07765 [Erysipelotrichaceae bacterium RD49]|nr:hypothetical protein [Erysipelotrichaceae bacterium RD49]